MWKLIMPAAVLAFFANAADCNLLNNPEFKKDASGFPADWCFGREWVSKVADVSEDGFVTMRAPKDGTSFKQSDIHLVPGGPIGEELVFNAVRVKPYYAD